MVSGQAAPPGPPGGVAGARGLKIVSVNLNLMPSGPLSILTTGCATDRARALAHGLLYKNSLTMDADVFYFQELYDDEARHAFFGVFHEAGRWEMVLGPRRDVVAHSKVADAPFRYDSGQAMVCVAQGGERVRLMVHEVC